MKYIFRKRSWVCVCGGGGGGGGAYTGSDEYLYSNISYINTLPKWINADYLNILLDLFILNSIRCLKSKKYGHGQTIYCKLTCSRCGQFDHGNEGRKEMFYLMTHSTHFIYGYMASDIWLRTILIVKKETRCRHIGYSFRLTARVLLYAPSHIQDSTYHGLCYTSRGALAGTRNSSMGPPHEGSIRRPIAP